MFKKFILAIILAGGLLTAAMPGRTAPSGDLALPMLQPVLEQREVRLERVDLEGWALKRGDDPVAYWREGKLADQLELRDGKLSITGNGGDRKIQLTKNLPQGGNISFSMEKINKNGRGYCYLYIKGTLTDLGKAADWERRLRSALAEGGGEHGLYLTLQGRLPRTLDQAQAQEWSRRLYRQLGGRINSTQQSERYLSLTGFTPLMGGSVMAGEKMVNLSLALVKEKATGRTSVYLANPVITSEY